MKKEILNDLELLLFFSEKEVPSRTSGEEGSSSLQCCHQVEELLFQFYTGYDPNMVTYTLQLDTKPFLRPNSEIKFAQGPHTTNCLLELLFAIHNNDYSNHVCRLSFHRCAIYNVFVTQYERIHKAKENVLTYFRW